MNLADEAKIAHVRSELGRGHVYRCPKAWLVRVKTLTAGSDLAKACEIALYVWRSGSNVNPRERQMRKLAGRRLS